MEKAERAERARAAMSCLECAAQLINHAVLAAAGGDLPPKGIARVHDAIGKLELRLSAVYQKATGRKP